MTIVNAHNIPVQHKSKQVSKNISKTQENNVSQYP